MLSGHQEYPEAHLWGHPLLRPEFTKDNAAPGLETWSMFSNFNTGKLQIGDPKQQKSTHSRVHSESKLNSLLALRFM